MYCMDWILVRLASWISKHISKLMCSCKLSGSLSPRIDITTLLKRQGHEGHDLYKQGSTHLVVDGDAEVDEGEHCQVHEYTLLG